MLESREKQVVIRWLKAAKESGLLSRLEEVTTDMWVTNPENLTAEQRGELEKLKRKFPELGRLAEHREALRLIFEDKGLTDPQVAASGHTLASAEAAGLDVRAVDVETSANAGASFHGRNAPGTCRLVVDRARGVLVGATFTGPDVAELLHSATVAIAGGVALEDLAHAVPTFPTRTEVWLGLLDQLGP